MGVVEVVEVMVLGGNGELQEEEEEETHCGDKAKGNCAEEVEEVSGGQILGLNGLHGLDLG